MLYGVCIMNFRDIQYVLTVSQEGGFSKAAKKLYVSQPCLSQSIQRLERELGAELFCRDNHTVTLTKAGKIFLEDGQEILNLCKKLRVRINDVIDSEHVHLRVGISIFYSPYYSHLIFPVFQQYYPSIKLEIVEDFAESLEKMLHNDRLDIFIAPAPVGRADVDREIYFQPLLKEQLFFALPKAHKLIHEILSSSTGEWPVIDLSLVKDEPFIMPLKGQKIRQLGTLLCNEAGFSPNVMLETRDLNTVNRLVSSGMGVGFVPEILARQSPMENVVYCQIKSEKTTRYLILAYKKVAYLSQAAVNFINLTKKTFKSNFQNSVDF